MSPTRVKHVSIATLIAGAVAAIALTSPLGADYPGPQCPNCDYAGPPIEALVHGHIGTFFSTQPVMGSFSLLWRAPFAAISYLGSHSIRWEYRLGVLACLLVVGLLAGWLTRIMERRGLGLTSQLVVAGLCVAGPMTFKSLYWGHPEELLAGSLCVGAVLLASFGRSRAAGLALGLALSTKPWAVLAALPVLIVARERRRALLFAALAVAVGLTLPMLLGDPSRFWHMAHVYGVAGSGVTPPDIWWPYGHQNGVMISPTGAAATYVVPSWIWTVAHPLVLALGVTLAVAYWLARRASRQPAEVSAVLRLLALILLLRCVLDPTDYSYYHAPFLLALLAGEALGRTRLPYLAIVSAAALWILNAVIAPDGGAGQLHTAYLLWSVPTAAYLAVSVFAPAWLERGLRSAPAPVAQAAVRS